MTERHAHGLVICSCGTVVADCGCRLKLVEQREAICQACRAAAQQLLDWRRSLCDVAYPDDLEVGRD